MLDSALRQLDPRVVALWRLWSLISTTVMTAVLLIAGVLLPFRFPFGWVAAAVAMMGVVEVACWPPIKHRAWSFAVRESDLFVSHGVLWRTTSVFPLARIQHVDTRRGPLERWLGLARLIVYTAGVRGADLEIPGLALADAERLRDHLAALSGGEDAV
ncbi:MAG TPA: PH domain-containing protein [Longimicrobiaceae bacterium]|nr:PH domain-containing protein [Longimicrobiaceae bacterium]